MTKKLLNPTPVGRAGSVFLLAQAGDLAAGNRNGPAQTHDLRLSLLSEIKPLQVWFKWGVYEPTDQAEYEQALAVEKAWDEADHPRHPAGTSEGGQFAPKDGAEGGSASRPLTGPEVRQLMEDLQNYRADEIAALREERAKRAGELIAEYERQLAAGLTGEEPAQKAMEHMKYRVSAIDEEIYEIEKDRIEKQRQWIMADQPGTVAIEFADAVTDDQRAKITAGLDEFNKLVGPKATGKVFFTPTRSFSGRARYIQAGKVHPLPTIWYSGGRILAVIHELGHHFENTTLGALDKVVDFYNQRTTGLPGDFLRDLQPGCGYSDQEIAVPDHFFDPYVGKVYYDKDTMKITATEIVSMGIEAMWADPLKFAREDPDHFDLIWDLIRQP